MPASAVRRPGTTCGGQECPPYVPMTTVANLTHALKDEARRLGFDLAGVCPAVTPTGLSRFHDWLAAAYAGEMHYLASRREAYAHPEGLLSGVRSLMVLAMNYRTAAPRQRRAGEGRVSRYAWGVDYHDLIHDRLVRLGDFLRQRLPQASVRGVVDTAPLLEREVAQLAGLGWIGKNTLLLNRRLGSWFFLAALLTDAELEYDEPHATNHCGTCRACLDACPTGAFVEPYVLDARRCISYLTIELRGPVPAELRSGMEDWVFGCDICQEVCPWNRRAPESDEAAYQPAGDMNPLELTSLFDLDDEAFRRRFRHTPLWRPRRRGMLRNAAIALGNRPTPGGRAALAKGLQDPEPVVRGACAWALGQHGGAEAIAALEERLDREEDLQVRDEIALALERVQAVMPSVLAGGTASAASSPERDTHGERWPPIDPPMPAW
jgi:epoxyqueuosine reductase